MITRNRMLIENRRQRALLVAYRFDADFSMESRLSWFRATHAAQQYQTTVLCAERESSEAERPELPVGLRVVCLPHNSLERFLSKMPGFFYLAYRLWHGRVYQFAKTMHRERAFSLVHQVSYCGYREPGQCWRLGVPFVWGPVGGTQNFPLRFLSQLDTAGAVKEIIRNGINTLQLRFSRRIRRACSASSSVLSANREVQTALAKSFGVASRCQLETGISKTEGTALLERTVGGPLRILWAGRFESWKALPLLLKALAKLPKSARYQLRILGAGRCERRWKRLAKRLDLARHIEWVGWPPYEARMPHYRWADVFTFTSLRDTSGTGLLESLACGVPIIGLNHQGARDVMDDDCSIRVPVTSPSQAIRDLSRGIYRLDADRAQLQEMSQLALIRAEDFRWDHLGEEMAEIYREVVSDDLSEQKDRERMQSKQQTKIALKAQG